VATSPPLFAIYGHDCSSSRTTSPLFCLGQAAVCGSRAARRRPRKGKRLALPHARVLLHQPWGQVGYGTGDRPRAPRPRKSCGCAICSSRSSAEHNGPDHRAGSTTNTDRDFRHRSSGGRRVWHYRRSDLVPAPPLTAPVRFADRSAHGGTPAGRGKRMAKFRRYRRAAQMLVSAVSRRSQVKKLIAGPGVYICDECIDLCNEIIEEDLTESKRASLRGVADPPPPPGPPRSAPSSTSTSSARTRRRRILSVSVYNHYPTDPAPAVRHRSVAVTRSELAKSKHLAARSDGLRQDSLGPDSRPACLNVPFAVADATATDRGRLWSARTVREHPSQADPSGPTSM